MLQLVEELVRLQAKKAFINTMFIFELLAAVSHIPFPLSFSASKYLQGHAGRGWGYS
jgi:hypothetical protein